MSPTKAGGIEVGEIVSFFFVAGVEGGPELWPLFFSLDSDVCEKLSTNGLRSGRREGKL